MLAECVRGVEQHWQAWCELAWQAKRIDEGDGARAEDMLTAVTPTLRYLQLMLQTLDDIERHGAPRLPGEPREVDGVVRVPVFPARCLFDRLLFAPIRAEARLRSGSDLADLYGENLKRVRGEGDCQPTVALVLGAGNVSSIPITDTLTKIFQENQSVLLKMNPVNEYVGPIFERAFASLIEADLLRVVYGGAEVGANLVACDGVDTVHITGSDRTHDAIVWGSSAEQVAERKSANSPLLQKPITSELGNVTPWIIVPGTYSARQLRFQAESIVTAITSNASFVCIAPKMILTARDWPQRKQFLDLIEAGLQKVPRRYAYYPGAAERFSRFAGYGADDPEYLPWTLRRGVDPVEEPHLFEEESFVCVCGETSLATSSPAEFLGTAVEFANENMWGTLAAGLTVPREFEKTQSQRLDRAVDRLQYGTVGINIWPGVAFALMSTPWGGFPGATLRDIQSGLGSVHNTYLLDQVEKSVLSSPLAFLPKPVWFPTHQCPERLAEDLLNLYLRPSIWSLPGLFWNALRG